MPPVVVVCQAQQKLRQNIKEESQIEDSTAGCCMLAAVSKSTCMLNKQMNVTEGVLAACSAANKDNADLSILLILASMLVSRKIPGVKLVTSHG